MKTNTKNIGIALFTAETVLFGCKKEDLRTLRPMNPATPAGTYSSRPDPKDPGYWKISSLYVQEKFSSDDTYKFKGWSFRFNSDGSVIATDNNKKVLGKWVTKMDGNKEYMVVNFGGEEPFVELNNQWYVAKKTPQYKLLQDNDNSDGRTADLLLEKL
jgi:hypothetical protein